MILAVNVGNTNIVIGCFQEEKIIFAERISTRQTSTALEYIVSFQSVLEIYGISLEQIEGSIISSVVPSIIPVIKQALKLITKKSVMIVEPGIKTGLKIHIDNPAQLGNNLVVAAVAALENYNPPIAIIDMGTATVISVIDSDKTYIGGMILPGVQTSLDALTEKTAQLPKVALEPPRDCIGKNTIDRMKSGAFYGAVHCIDNLLEKIEQDLNMPVTAVATGGLAKYIIPYCKRQIDVDDMLLLKGLRFLYLKNIRKDTERN
ncbi:MAG: type III pantothenate kinase [Ruminococcus sp.]|nr:type III pantothenate kinase [Ruminococcus sp.]